MIQKENSIGAGKHIKLKRKVNIRRFLVVVQILLILLLSFFIYKQSIVSDMIQRGTKSKYPVIDKRCRVRGGSYFIVKHNSENYRIEYYGSNCEELIIGSTVELYYSNTLDFFYIPESATYKRYIYGLMFLLIGSFAFLLIKYYRGDRGAK